MQCVCYDERYITQTTTATDPVTGGPLRMYLLHTEAGEVVTRFSLPGAGEPPTRWEIVDAARHAERAADRAKRRPARLACVR